MLSALPVPHDTTLRALLLLAAIAWLFAAIGWLRVFQAGDDAASRMDRVREVALVMVLACLVTGGAAAFAVW